jgi:hypothetical protein
VGYYTANFEKGAVMSEYEEKIILKIEEDIQNKMEAIRLAWGSKELRNHFFFRSALNELKDCIYNWEQAKDTATKW